MSTPAATPAPPILPYDREPAAARPWNPLAPAAAAHLIALLQAAHLGLHVEHIGSSAIPGCDGKGILDLMLLRRSEDELVQVRDLLAHLGFQPQHGPRPWPESRPCRVGSIWFAGEQFRIHAHLLPHDSPEVDRLRHFRDWLTQDDDARATYIAAKRDITADGEMDPDVYASAKAVWVTAFLQERAGEGTDSD